MYSDSAVGEEGRGGRAWAWVGGLDCIVYVILRYWGCIWVSLDVDVCEVPLLIDVAFLVGRACQV